MNIQTVIINEEEYYVINKQIINNNIYYCLISVDDENKLILRKEALENDKKILVGLQDEDEFNLVMEKINPNNRKDNN